ncbi:unnamed protein product [Echinostoma caproni]|uniref:CABIT domain-containing protein n=1 Tax=Echinostoma caproni TaxID=27848 RepID=A0A183AE22_9TREM|nr:unnamed protein product [Echinostoma caproni]
MNVFERLQNRLAKTATLVPHPAEKITPPVDQPVQPSLPTQAQTLPHQGDYTFHSSLQTQKNYPDVNVHSAGDNYECSEEWNYPTGSKTRSTRVETIVTPEPSRSGSRPAGQRLGLGELDDAGLPQTAGEFSSSEDEADASAQAPAADGDYANYPRSNVDNRKSVIQPESRDAYSDVDDRSASNSSSSRGPSAYMSQSGILWCSEQPQPLEELVPRFRSNPPGSTYLTKAIAQRSGCRCALCGHDSLLLFPVLDTSLALASWASWSIPSKSHNRSAIGYDRNGVGPTVATVTEVHAQLAVFRQCRGWYEVLNENQQAIPHLTTVEQFRRAKPATFLIRRDLKCLAAPPTLLIPPPNDVRPNPDGPPPVAFPSSVVAVATSPDTLNNSVSETIPAGTLMHLVTYLPHCQLKRGRKVKELGLILATKRVPGSPIRRSPSGELSNGNNLPSRAYYIGLEDSTPALLPPKFSISPVAGPENISGVHSLASILRKFRLPLSVRPVYGTEGCGSFATDQTERLSNGSASVNRNLSPNSTLFQCGLAAVQGLQFTEKHFLRLQSLCRGDILIFAPITSPERLFLITPSMLRDHVFQLGSSSDPAYERLLEGHRLQSINFLASAHPRDSLNYLVRHMRDVTREPRESYATRKTNRHKSESVRGSNTDSGVPDLTQEEMFQIYDDLDDIYFFIRHGYYPSKGRGGDTPNRTSESNNIIRSAKNSFSGPSQQTANSDQSETELMSRKQDNSQTRTNMPTAEQLLAASLKTPIRNHSFQTRWSNGSGNAASTYRIQPKEYGI